MTTRFRLPLAALILAAPASLAAQSAQDFQLPPAPTPTPSPNVQGPVDVEGGAVPARPRPIRTAAPTPASTQPVATPTAAPRITPEPVIDAQPSRVPQAQPARTPSSRVTPSDLPQPQATAGADQPIAEPQAAPSTAPAPFPGIEPIAPPETDTGETESDAGSDWPWPMLLGGGALLAVLLAAFALWRRRAGNSEPPEIERPVVARPEVAPAALPVAASLQIRAEALKLTRSLANATLDYRVTVINRSTSALRDVKLSADIISAHGDLPAEQQVATSSSLLEQRHQFDRIAPGQSVRYEGKLMLSLGQARVIRQGSMALLVPLLRVRVDGAEDAPVVRTFVIGQGLADGGRVAPFRLDEGMRSWEPVAARALD